MMKKLFLVPFFMIGFVPLSHAQLFKKLRQKVENAVDKKLDDVIYGKGKNNKEEIVIEKEQRESKEEAISSATKESVIKFPEDVGTQEKEVLSFKDRRYVFDTKITYNLVSQNVTLEMMNYLNSKNGDYSGRTSAFKVKQLKTFTIDDKDLIIELTEIGGEKIKNVYPRDASENEEKSPIDVQFDEKLLKQTGNKKTILGYSCVEYIYETDELKFTSWIAPTFKNRHFKNTMIKGWHLETNVFMKKINSKYTIKAKEVDTNYYKTIDTAAYLY